MKYKTFRLSEKQVWAIKTMMSNTNPSGGADDIACRKSILKKFEGFGQYYNMR